MAEVSDKFHPGHFRRGLRAAGLSAIEYRVAVELSEYSSVDKSIVWPSVTTLAADCEVAPRSVVRVLNRLEAKGFIARGGNRTGGRGHTTRWRLLVKGDPPVSLSDGKRVTLKAQRVTPVVVKGDPPVTRSSKEGEKEVVCSDCRNGGVVLNTDGKPGPTVRICHCDHTWHVATAEELADLADEGAA